MGKKEKLIEKLKSNPKDFTFEEMETLLTALGFVRFNKGKTRFESDVQKRRYSDYPAQTSSS